MTSDGSTAPDVWFTNRDGQQAGPFDLGEVQRQFMIGGLRPQDAVWRAGWPDWYPAGEVFKNLIVPPPLRAFASPPQQEPREQPRPAPRSQPTPQPQAEPETDAEAKSGKVVGQVTLIGRTVNIHRFTGTVMASQRSSHTTVSGGTNNQPVTSHTVHINEIFVRLPDDSERSFNVEPAGIPIRPGNTVTFLLGIPEGKEIGFYTTIWNHDQRKMGHIGPGVNKVAGPPFYPFMYSALGVAAFIGFFMSFGPLGRFMVSELLVLSLVGIVGLFVLTMVNRSRLRSAMAAALADLRK